LLSSASEVAPRAFCEEATTSVFQAMPSNDASIRVLGSSGLNPRVMYLIRGRPDLSSARDVPDVSTISVETAVTILQVFPSTAA